MLLHGGGQPPRLPEQHDERHDRDHRDVERQLLDVPEPEAEHVAEVVAALADDAVGAEQVGERPPASDLPDDDEQPGPDGPREEREETADLANVAPQ